MSKPKVFFIILLTPALLTLAIPFMFGYWLASDKSVAEIWKDFWS